MAFDVVTASYQEREKVRSPLVHALRAGLTMGGVTIFLAAVGIVRQFNERWIIADVLTLGQFALGFCALVAGVLVARKTKAVNAAAATLQGLIAGATAAGILSLLVLIMSEVKLRFMFVALSKPLFNILTFKLGTFGGIAVLIACGATLGLLGALLYVTPARYRRPIVTALSAVALVGLFQELIQLMIQREGILSAIRETFFTWDGLSLQGAILVALIALGVKSLWMWRRERIVTRYHGLPTGQQKTVRVSMTLVGMLVFLLIPLAAGNFIGQVFLLVGLYVLMGYGLNLELGLCGLLDLGFVAFFAIGAYTTALLTADSPVSIANWSFWEALPVAVVLSLIVGVIFGVPVLKVRGDYLAVATLGLGEIVRVLVLSDFAGPVFGGAQGILNIPRPHIGDFAIDNPVKLFYLTVILCGIVAFIAWRLQYSRLGRAWTAIRDDEDVAQALGINLINCKLLAYGLGAAFCGVAGAIFGVMLGSIFPHSFQLLISINVLALIIVGGLGSLPGVALGAAALIGLPELLREFGEFRFLFYGMTIVAMMRLKPEGLWPSESVKRERHSLEVTQAEVEAELHGETAASEKPAE
ncbi:MAG: branched-chain amino acid ABC transporter permease [Pseudomonadota bacterium]